MITSIKNTNAEQYSILFSEAVKALMSHKSNGDEITTPMPGASTDDNAPAIQYEEVAAVNYEPNTCYYWDGTEFVLATELTADPEKTYYKLINDYDYIASLNEYFSNIRTLALIDTKFTRLALDEPTFDIDLNTREIKVPEIFQKNGVSVEGDEIAEIIYFKVNRYYDMIDLATQNIYIQWRSAATDEEGEYIEGASAPWCVDYETYPGYIIFGWPISSKITAAAGQIAFAVRFYTYKPDNLSTSQPPLTYSLSTLTQVVTVKPALNFDLVNKILREGAQEGFISDNNISLLINRLQNSDNAGAEPAAEPEFIMQLRQSEEIPVENDQTYAWLDLLNGHRIRPIVLQVQAISPDAGSISYVANKYKLNGDPITPYSGTTTFIPSKDESKITNKEYYYSKGDGLGYGRITDDSVISWADIDWAAAPEDRNLYERVYEITLNSIGRYRVGATNKVGKSTASLSSYEIIVLDPKQVSITALQSGQEGIELSVTPTAEDQDKSIFTYQWKKRSLADGIIGEYTPISGANSQSYDTTPENEDDDKTGYYKVEVHNNLHVDYDGVTELYTAAETAQSDVARITKPAQACDIEAVSDQKLSRSGFGTRGFEILATPKSSEIRNTDLGDNITYQWYDYNWDANSGKTPAEDAADAQNLNYHRSLTSPDTLIPNATNAYFIPGEDQRGPFYCEVTNNYNGDTAVINSMFFEIYEG